MTSAPEAAEQGDRPGAQQSFSQIDSWQEAVQSTFVPVEVVPLADSMHAQLTASVLEEVLVAAIDGSPQAYRRREVMLRLAEEPYCKLVMPVQGTCILEQDDRQLEFLPGESFVFDCARPYTLSFPEGVHTELYGLPRQRLLGELGGSFGLQPTLLRDSSAVRLLSGFLALVQKDLMGHSTNEDSARLVSNTIMSLTTSCLANEMATHWLSPSDNAFIKKGLAYIDEHIADPELTVTTIAAHCAVSPRHLQRVFATRGTTVTSYIRGRRLERARADLLRKVPEASISTVASHWGFTDLAHFSHLFKAAYGESPSAYRRNRL